MALFRRNKKTAVENRADVNQGPYLPSRSFLSDAGADVNEMSALGIAAFWRGVNILANTVSSFELDAMRNGEELLPTPKILSDPWPQIGRVSWLAQIVVSLVMRGNAYLLLGGFDKNLYPTTAMVLPPDWVQVTMRDGAPVYKINGQEFDQYEILHIPYFTMPGALVGMGVLEVARNSLGSVQAANRFAARYWADSGMPPLALHVARDDLDPEEAERISLKWAAKYAGGNRAPAVLTPDITLETIGITPEDGQFLQTRQFNLNEIALIVGVPGSWLGAPGTSMTYSNMTDDFLRFVKLDLRPLIIRIEHALSTLLPRGTEVVMNMDTLLRGSTQERYAAYAVAIQHDVLLVNEARSLEGLPPVPWGDQPYIVKTGPDTAVPKATPATDTQLEEGNEEDDPQSEDENE